LPKISIIIPVHNMQDYLRESLDSAVGQTLDDIEVICVDDHSDDASPEMLHAYAARDPRVRVITFSENRSVSQARKEGVLASTGEYVMFLDADDSIELDACERLYSAMQADPVDILHFGTAITNEMNLPHERVTWLRGFVRPHDGVLEGSSIFEACFAEDRAYNSSIWDKLYSADLCKRSFSRIKDGSFTLGEDQYAYFVLSYFARTYRGMPDEVLYNYNFGRGGTGHNLLSLSQFGRYCSMALVVDAIKDFLVEESVLDRYEAQYERIRDRLLNDCVANWNKYLGADDKAAGFDRMLEYWEASEVVAKIAQTNWGDQGHISRLLKESQSLAHDPREVRVVGTYYHRYENGGAERNLSILMKLWLSVGYKVVLFTDLPPSPDDYELPEGVQRVVLPSFFEVKRGNYLERAREMERTIKEHGIDVMVYHAWVSPILLWDLLLCRTTGAAFVAHCHSVFSQPERRMRTYFADMPFVYHLCDAVVALSEVDRTYWGNFNDNVVTVVNPLTFDLDGLELAPLGGKNVLWLGRMSDEKRPHDALEIFAKVLQEVPDAKLIMVGSCPEEEYMDGLRSMADELGIQGSVEMCGFQTDVLPFYAKSSVLLITSEFEGFPLTLSEGQSAGVPCVMYDLPYLTLARQRRGLVGVEPGDLNAAADAVVALLQDPEYRRSLGREARANIEELARFDFAGTWRGLFDGLSHPAAVQPLDETTRIMWETLFDHYRTGAVRRNLEIRELKKKLKAQRRAQADLRASWAFRVGRAITAVPRKLRKLMRSSR
jgi:glycosyltransferase involved in cell wall biosynthesis